MTRLPSGLKFSLVELLALVLVAGLSAAALRSGSALAAIVWQAGLWSFAAAAVVAIFSRASWRAFAVGYLIGAAIYVGPLLYVGESEFDPYETKLPLTQPMLSLWRAMEVEAWVHEPTGERFDVWTTNVTQSFDQMGPLNSSGDWPTPVTRLDDGRIVYSQSNVSRHEFMLVAHAFLAMASGYVFGKFAAIVQRRAAAANWSEGASHQEIQGRMPSAQNDT